MRYEEALTKDAKEYLEVQITAFNRLVDIIEGLKNLEDLKRFDGKVINKRIQDVIGAYSRGLERNYISFQYYSHKENCYTLEVSSSMSYKTSYYYSVTNSHKIYDIPVVDGKRFILEGFISALDKGLEELRGYIEKLQKELKDVEDVVREYLRVCDSIKSFNNNYTSFVRQGMSFNRI